MTNDFRKNNAFVVYQYAFTYFPESLNGGFSRPAKQLDTSVISFTVFYSNKFVPSGSWAPKFISGEPSNVAFRWRLVLVQSGDNLRALWRVLWVKRQISSSTYKSAVTAVMSVKRPPMSLAFLHPQFPLVVIHNIIPILHNATHQHRRIGINSNR